LFRPKWLRKYNRKLSKEIKFYLAKRIANSGRPTFALYYTPLYQNNEGFPQPFEETIDMPIWYIKEFLEAAVKGMKILKKVDNYYGDPDSIIKATRIGYELERFGDRLGENLLAFI